MLKKLIIIIFFCLPLNHIVLAQTIIPKIDFDNAGVLDVVQALTEQAGLDLVVSADPALQKRVTLHLNNISAEEAIDQVLRTNGMVYEKKGNSILVSTLPQDVAQTGYKRESVSIELKYISAEKGASVVNKIFPSVLVICGGRANNLVMSGKESEICEAQELIKNVDRPIPQILIEGKVIEISKNDSIRIGIDYNNGVFNFVNAKHDDIRTAVNALLSDGKANILASPRIAALDNCEAVINIGNRIPYAVPVSSSGSSTQWTVEYIDAGVKLKITPRVGKDDQIIMVLQPEVSSISEWKTTPAGEFPVISTRNASSTLRTKSGETIVVGGLDSETERVNVSRTPILGQFPLLNLFFQNRTVEKNKTEIVFLITPYVI